MYIFPVHFSFQANVRASFVRGKIPYDVGFANVNIYYLRRFAC